MLPRPILLYDGECRFCRRSVVRLRRIAGGRILYSRYQRVAARYLPGDAGLGQGIRLVLPSGAVRVGAAAIYTALGYTGGGWAVLSWLYTHIGFFRAISGFIYGLIARYRRHLR